MAFFNRFGGRNLSGKGIVSRTTYTVNVTSDIDQYNVKTAALAAGWDGTSACNIVVNIASGVTVYSSTTSAPALKIEYGAISGVSTKINNSGMIIGAGGAGGNSAYHTYKPQWLGVTDQYGQTRTIREQIGLHWYWQKSDAALNGLAKNGGDAIYTDSPLTVFQNSSSNNGSNPYIGGGGGGGSSGRTAIYMNGSTTLNPNIYNIVKGTGTIFWTANGSPYAGGGGGGGRGGGNAAGGTASSPAWFYDNGYVPMTYNGYSGAAAYAAMTSNAGTAGSLTAAGTGGVGKDDNSGAGRTADGGGSGGGLGAAGSPPAYSNPTFNYNFNYENEGPIGSGVYMVVNGATEFNPDGLWGGTTWYRGSGGYAVKKSSSAVSVTFAGSAYNYYYGTVGT